MSIELYTAITAWILMIAIIIPVLGAYAASLEAKLLQLQQDHWKERYIIENPCQEVKHESNH